eukprot:gnl/TRDRNA2_/TRDRNA2_128249_c1_seq4.p1 gnl/TRDRNA2_/TRDRNA2_128249_c1~~gnl/TRDRNA2_/TRDRNA2_128249_c1_seq4.p1  ORF type:complete len:519 (+),score=39.62 gnl/TRDRNA2_/TRDRNA2_128249_c1_seq4:203-1558(+)
MDACGKRLKHLDILGPLNHSSAANTSLGRELGAHLATSFRKLQTLVSHASPLPLSKKGLGIAIAACRELRRVHLDNNFGTSVTWRPSETVNSAALIAEAGDAPDPVGQGPISLSFKSCSWLTSSTVQTWLKDICGLRSSGLEELQLARLTRYAPNEDEIAQLASYCDGPGRGLCTLVLEHLPLLSPLAPQRWLSVSIHTLVELRLCSLRLAPGTWKLLPQLHALRDLTLRDLIQHNTPASLGADVSHDATEEARAALLQMLRGCAGLRQLDLYRMGAAVTDRLVLMLAMLNLTWHGGPGLRWLRLDLRYSAASEPVVANLAASSGCQHFEMRLLPVDPKLVSCCEHSLDFLARAQALVRGWRTRRSIRRRAEAAVRIQAVWRGRPLHRLYLGKKRGSLSIQAWARGIAERRRQWKRTLTAVQLQAAVRGWLARCHSVDQQTDGGLYVGAPT